MSQESVRQYDSIDLLIQFLFTFVRQSMYPDITNMHLHKVNRFLVRLSQLLKKYIKHER